jgi:hypothetical protein
MEEADHLADRVGVVAKKMLDIGTTSHLRNKHGHGFHIQLICASAPHTSAEEMESVKQWVEATLPGAQMEGYPYHGQLRFNIPSKTTSTSSPPEKDANAISPSASNNADNIEDPAAAEVSVGKLFVLLEDNKEKLGLEFYSVSPSTFDEVFLRVVEKHHIGEEDDPPVKKDWKYWVKSALPFLLLV